MAKAVLLCCFICGMLLNCSCYNGQSEETETPPIEVKIPYEELFVDEHPPDIFTDPGIPGCSLADLPPFHWKEVDSGIVDIRAPEEYATQTESLYEAGYLGYQQDRLEFPARYQSIPEMTYEEYLATCNVFPNVDFSKYALLGYHTTGTGCEVTFQKQVTRNDQKKQLLYEVTVVVEGACQKETNNRNLILVPPIAKDYTVTFSKKVQRETARDSNPALMAELVAGSS